MVRKPLLLVLGIHGDSETGEGQETRFFRKSAAPFIKKHARSGKVLVSLENHLPLVNPLHSIFGAEKTEAMFRRVQAYDERKKEEAFAKLDGIASEFLSKMNEILEEHAQAGNVPAGGLWDVEECVNSINSRDKGRITVVSEPTSGRIFFEFWRLQQTSKEPQETLDSIKRSIKAKAWVHLLRDTSLAKDLEGRFDGFDAFVVLRGGAHQPIRSYIDDQRYEIHTKMSRRASSLLDFGSLAMREFYEGRLDDERLGKYAELQASMQKRVRGLLSEAPGGLNMHFPINRFLALIALKHIRAETMREHKDIVAALGIGPDSFSSMTSS